MRLYFNTVRTLIVIEIMTSVMMTKGTMANKSTRMSPYKLPASRFCLSCSSLFDCCLKVFHKSLLM